MLTADRFTMLGKTVPEPTKDHRVFVCSAGYQPDLGLIRIYPLARHGAPQRWHQYRVPLEANPQDSRRESWKVAGDRSPGAHEHINGVFAETSLMPAAERRELLDDKRFAVGSIAEANDKRMSLALIRPKRVPDLELEHNPDSPDSPQLRLFDDGLPAAQGAKRFPYMPRLLFTDDDGDHRLMLRDWGCFEFMRKHPGRVTELGSALSIGEKSVLLVGNLNHHRKAWLVISVLNIGAAQMSLPMEAA